MTDTEIAKYMNLVRSTIHHHRTSSLIALKKIMEEIRLEKEIIQSYYRIILLCRQRPEMWKQLTGF